MKELENVQPRECIDYLAELRPTTTWTEYVYAKNFLYDKYLIPDLQIDFGFEVEPLYVP